uniref:PLAT domain-containing protein n=1 Tax=Romanomermis culicivorax TaxID=13658 RepID=A0A915J0Z7_ROMCU
FGAAWHLEKVAVHDASANVTYVFPCNKWLSKKDDDRQLCRVLNVEATSKKIPRHFQMQREAEAKMAAEAAKKSATQQPQQATPYPVYQQGYAPQGKISQPSAPHETSPQSRATAPYPTQHSPLYPMAQLGYMPQGEMMNAQQSQGILGQAPAPYASQQAPYPPIPSQGQSYQQSQNIAPQSQAPYQSQQSPYLIGQYAPQGQMQQYATGFTSQPYVTQGAYQQAYNQQMPAYQSPFG